MSEKIEHLHNQISSLPLGDLLLLASQAVNMPLPDIKIDIILKYVEIAIVTRRIERAGK
jgi:hypothetical protein